MKNVFVSYSRKNLNLVSTIIEDIKALDYQLWFDREQTGGQIWWENILTKIQECDIFVFALSQESLISHACKLEIDYACDLRKPILPVLLSEGVSTNLLPSCLAQIQFVDYRNPDRHATIELVKALNNLPEPPPLPEPLPPAPEAPVSYLGRINEKIRTTSLLSYEEQSALIVDLKGSLRTPETTGDALILLQNLRKRRDLLAAIAEEIDDLLTSISRTSDHPSSTSEKKSSYPQFSSKKNPLKVSPQPQLAGRGSQDTVQDSTSKEHEFLRVRISSNYKSTMKKFSFLVPIGLFIMLLVQMLTSKVGNFDFIPIIIIIPILIGMHAFFRFLIRNLVDEAWDAGNRLIFKNKGVEENVLINDILTVKQKGFFTHPRVEITLRRASKLGGKISFSVIGGGNLFKKEPIVSDLIKRIESNQQTDTAMR